MTTSPDQRDDALYAPIEWQRSGDYTRHPYDTAGDRQDHDLPARGAQRLPAPDAVRAPDAFNVARDDDPIGVIILTGQGDEAFCSGGDQRIRGDDGYIGDDAVAQPGIGRLNVLDLQIQIRRTPKPVVAMVAGYAIGGGHVLHVVCDLTIAADNAKLRPDRPEGRVSFDGGYGSGLLARIVGQKKAREIWFLCRQYDARAGARHGPRQHGRAARPSSRTRRSRGAARCCSIRRSRCA